MVAVMIYNIVEPSTIPAVSKINRFSEQNVRRAKKWQWPTIGMKTSFSYVYDTFGFC